MLEEVFFAAGVETPFKVIGHCFDKIIWSWGYAILLCVWPDVLPIKGWREVRMSHGNDKQKKLQEMPTIFIRLTEKSAIKWTCVRGNWYCVNKWKMARIKIFKICHWGYKKIPFWNLLMKSFKCLSIGCNSGFAKKPSRVFFPVMVLHNGQKNFFDFHDAFYL